MNKQLLSNQYSPLLLLLFLLLFVSSFPQYWTMAPLSSYAVVVAIDFGTTRSGYRFAFAVNPATIHPNTTWEHAIAEGKTSTEVLLKRDDLSLVAFGYEARNIYVTSANKDDYLYFSNFKMTLHNSEGPIRSKVKASNCDDSISTELLISKCIREISDRAFRQLNEALSVPIGFKEICWVVTVPAIWDIAARQAMLNSATLAGIAASNIVIALEPEGAVLACLENEVCERSNLDIYSNNFMVVDAGGGTIDITVHKKTSDGSLAELHSPTGGNWGSSYVNKQFEQLLCNLLGMEYINSIKGSEYWMAVMDSFELAKVNFSAKHPIANIGISGILPEGFDAIKIAQYNAQYGTKLEYNRGILRCASVLPTFFEPTISSITSHIDTLLKKAELKQVKYLFLVGGYAENVLLQERIKEKFSGVLKVVIPPRPGAAVVNGAVRYGLDPSAISSRIARHSIGVEHWTDWDEEVHKGRDWKILNGTKHCINCITSFVSAGMSVPADKEVTHHFESLSPNRVTISVFASTSKRLYCTNYDDATYVGDLSIQTSLGAPLMVTMKFGGTTFSVTCRCKRTGNIVGATFTFNLDKLPCPTLKRPEIIM